MWEYECNGIIIVHHTMDQMVESLKGHRGKYNHLMPEFLHQNCKEVHVIYDTGKPCDWFPGERCYLVQSDEVSEHQDEVLSALDAVWIRL